MSPCALLPPRIQSNGITAKVLWNRRSACVACPLRMASDGRHTAGRGCAKRSCHPKNNVIDILCVYYPLPHLMLSLLLMGKEVRIVTTRVGTLITIVSLDGATVRLSLLVSSFLPSSGWGRPLMTYFLL